MSPAPAALPTGNGKDLREVFGELSGDVQEVVNLLENVTKSPDDYNIETIVAKVNRQCEKQLADAQRSLKALDPLTQAQAQALRMQGGQLASAMRTINERARDSIAKMEDAIQSKLPNEKGENAWKVRADNYAASMNTVADMTRYFLEFAAQKYELSFKKARQLVAKQKRRLATAKISMAILRFTFLLAAVFVSIAISWIEGPTSDFVTDPTHLAYSSVIALIAFILLDRFIGSILDKRLRSRMFARIKEFYTEFLREIHTNSVIRGHLEEMRRLAASSSTVPV